MRNQVHAIPEKPNPKVTALRSNVPDDVLVLLQYLLPEDEPLLALAEAKSYDSFFDNDVYLGITLTQFFISGKNKMSREGIIDKCTRSLMCVMCGSRSRIAWAIS